MKKRLFFTTALITLSFIANNAMAEVITERQVINSDEERSFSQATAEGIDSPFQSGGVIKNAGKVNIDDSEFTENSADYGGAIYNSKELNIDSSEFENNHASSSGGAIHNSSKGTVNITGNTTFEGNTHSPNAGDAIPNDVFNTGTLNLTPDENEKIYFGGGIDGDGGDEHGTMNIDGKGEVWVRNELTHHDVNLNSGTLVIEPATSAEASRFVIEENAEFSANNTEFKNSHAEGKNGGAISRTFTKTDDAGSEIVSISSSEFKNNSAKNGGAISNRKIGYESGEESYVGPTIIENTVFNENEAEYSGGAIYNEGTIQIENSEFVGNKTGELQAYGGAIYNGSEGMITLNHTDFKDNTAGCSGGAIHNRGTVAIGGNATFSGNKHAPNAGGYIANDIYNTGSLWLLPDTDEIISFEGGIDGDGGYGEIGLSGKGKVTISNELAYQDLTIISGTMELTPDTNVIDSHFNVTSAFEDDAILKATGVSFKDLIIDDGEYGGVIYNSSKVNIADSEFADNNINSSESSYGAVILNDGYVSVENTKFNNNKIATIEDPEGGDVDNKGGAIANYGSMDIKNAEFTNNEIVADESGNYGGAVSNKFSFMDIENSEFNNNKITGDYSANYGGAISNSNSYLDVKDTDFKNNSISGSSSNYGGAVYNEKDGNITVSNSTFTENAATGKDNSSGFGGAIYNEEGSITITGSTFDGNSATGSAVSSGGAIYNSGKMDEEQNPAAIIKISDSTFINNTSSWGGAIDNYGKLELSDVSFVENIATYKNENGGVGGALRNYWTATINNGSFINNSATELGGAIYNENQLEFTGNTVFEGNTENGQANDIYNMGKIKVSDSLTLDGGMTGYSANVPGKVTFTDGSNLTVKAGITSIVNNQVKNEGATLHMNIGNGFSGDYALITDTSSLDNEFTIADNNLYNISATDTKGTYTISKKSNSEIADSIGATSNEAATITAVTDGDSENSSFNEIADNMGNLIQSDNPEDVKAVRDAAEAMAPEVAPMIEQTQTEVVQQVFNAVGNRLSGSAENSEGISSGDVTQDAAVWVQGLTNHAILDETSKHDGFKADTAGAALGVEKKFDNNVKAGVGYAYNKTDVDGKNRDTDVKTHTILAYGEYKPSDWFVNGIISYSWSDYKEKKNVFGNIADADYDAETLAMQLMSGYDFYTQYATITPEAGLRYMHIKGDNYTDSLGQDIKFDNSNIVTGVIGSRVSKAIETTSGMRLTPKARLAMTYDLNRAHNKSTVALPNGSSYSINGKTLDRFGVEVGAGLTAEINDNVEMSLGYEGGFRKDYQSHSGLFDIKYKF